MRARLVAFAFFGSSFSFSFSTCAASVACVAWRASAALESEVRARGEFAPLA